MMRLLVSNLPWAQVEKWSKFLKEQEEEAKGKPFEVFLKWLKKASGSWEVVVASGVGRKGRSKSEHPSFHVKVEDSSGKTCFNRGKKAPLEESAMRLWTGGEEHVLTAGKRTTLQEIVRKV